jgi:hypothetical protein
MRVSNSAGLGSRCSDLSRAMSITELDELMREARVLAVYAVRAGKFPADSNVFEVSERLEREASPVVRRQLLGELCREIDVLSKAIAPTTLKALLRRGSFVGHARQAIASITPFVIGLLTLLLTLYLVFQSSQLHQANIAIREYQEWTAQQPKEKLYAAWKMYRYERVLNVKAPPLAQLDAYQKLVEDARQLVDKGSAIQLLLQESANILYFPRFLEDATPPAVGDFIARLNQGVVRADALQRLPAYPDSGAQQTVPSTTECRDVAPHSLKVAMAVPPKEIADIDAYFQSIECFLRRLNISEERVSYSAWNVIYQTKSKINLLVAWLLPGLYGLLGACVYLMRDLLLVRGGVISRDTSVLSMLSLLLRVALGGLAGIIIGWFWVPVPMANDNSVVPISSIPFGIAFLAGFSIETLFSLLDRVNRSIEEKSSETKAEVAAKTSP